MQRGQQIELIKMDDCLLWELNCPLGLRVARKQQEDYRGLRNTLNGSVEDVILYYSKFIIKVVGMGAIVRQSSIARAHAPLHVLGTLGVPVYVGSSPGVILILILRVILVLCDSTHKYVSL